MTMQSTGTKRQEWMQILAHAGDDLQQFEKVLKPFEYSYIRTPETGMVMARGQAGGTGQVFNLGEVSVTRCVVLLADGAIGYSYVLGRSSRHAELAAVVDGLLQGEGCDEWFDRIIQPLQEQQLLRRAVRNSEITGSKVNFFTMVRGD